MSVLYLFPFVVYCAKYALAFIHSRPRLKPRGRAVLSVFEAPLPRRPGWGGRGRSRDMGLVGTQTTTHNPTLGIILQTPDRARCPQIANCRSDFFERVFLPLPALFLSHLFFLVLLSLFLCGVCGEPPPLFFCFVLRAYMHSNLGDHALIFRLGGWTH